MTVIIFGISARLELLLSKWAWRRTLYSGGRSENIMSSYCRCVGPCGGSNALRRSRQLPMMERYSSGSCPEQIRVLLILACSARTASCEIPLNVSRNVAHASGPYRASSSGVVSSNLRAMKKAEPPVEKDSTLNRSSLAASHDPRAVPWSSSVSHGRSCSWRIYMASL